MDRSIEGVDAHAPERQQALRVVALTIIAVGVWSGALAQAAGRVLLAGERGIGDLRVADERIPILAALGLLVALFAVVLVRSAEATNDRRAHLGLLVGVLTAGLLGAVETVLTPDTAAALRPGWAGVWMIVFPLVIAAGTRDTAVALVGAWLLHAVGRHLLLARTASSERDLASLAATGLMAIVAFVSLLVSRTLRRHLREGVVRTRELGNYVLEGELGRGSMGVVWRARHRILRRDAAVKVITDRGEGARDLRRRLERFEQEAQVMARLASPHTVSLYDFGRTPEGGVYYAMELLVGEDLRSLITAHGPLHPERTAFLLRQAADSLAEAHALGLVHRDVKPANLFVSRANRRPDHLKVLDFGLASSIDAGPVELAGTPAYLAPEAWDGHAPTPANDIYALGLVAWYLCTGEEPMARDDLEATRAAHRRGLQHPRRLLRAERDVPDAMVDLVVEMLDGDPARRPTADVVGVRLARVSFASPWTVARAERWWALHAPRIAGERADRPRAGSVPNHQLPWAPTPHEAPCRSSSSCSSSAAVAEG
jgi:serine/threonine-protein kinase